MVLSFILVELINVQSISEAKDVTVHSTRQLTEAEQAAAKLELEAIQVAEQEDELAKSIVLLTTAIEMAPNYPSPLNNRAQVYRLRGQVEDALNDLNRAIELSTDFPGVRRQALCQRAWILHSQGKVEDAYEDFAEAGRLGNEDARKMAVRCNPYARLCNTIMQEMLEKLYYSQPSDPQ